MELVAEIEREAALRPSGLPVADDGASERPGAGSDAEVIAAVMSGETQRFGELVRRYTEMVATFAYVRTRDRDLADEIAQETMVRAYEKLWSLKVHRHFSHWLLGIAGNVTMQTMARRSRGAALSLDEAGVDSSARSPRDEVASKEAWSGILQQVDALDPRYKVPFVMKHQENLSCDEIARRLGVPAGTVRGRLSRAYGILRSRLAAQKP